MNSWRILSFVFFVSTALAGDLSLEQVNLAGRQACAGERILPQAPLEVRSELDKVNQGTKSAAALQNIFGIQTCLNIGTVLPCAAIPPAAPFSPSTPSGLLFWYRDDSIVSSGGFVSQWSDKSGNAIHLLQSSAISKPEVDVGAINGHDAILGDGSNDFLLSTATFTLARPYHIFGVMKCAYSGSAYAFLMIGDGTSKLIAYNYTDGATLTYEWDTSAHSMVAADPPADGTWFYFEFLGKAGANATTLRINNGTPTLTTFTADPTASSPISLFARTDGSNASASEIAEIFCYSEEKTGTDRTNIITYLQTRYGL